MKLLKTLLITALLFCLPFIFSHCKKQKQYVEDPKKTTKTPHERLLGGWELISYTLNDISIADTMSKIAGCNLLKSTETRLSYYDNYDRIELVMLACTLECGDENSFDNVYITLGSCSSADIKAQKFHKLFVTPFHYTPTITRAKWEITKLYEADLSLRLRTDTGEYKMMFKKYTNFN